MDEIIGDLDLVTFLNFLTPFRLRWKRKYIPELPGYQFFTLDPLPGSSGGIAFYFKDQVCFRVSKAMSSAENSILWIYLQHHNSPTKDLYLCVVYAVHAGGSADKKISFWKELNGSTSYFQQNQEMWFSSEILMLVLAQLLATMPRTRTRSTC